MLSTTPFRVVTAAAVLAVCCFATAIAQQPPVRRPAQPAQPAPPAAAQPAQPVANQFSDHVIEQWLTIDNQGEIELAKWATNRAHDEDLKNFLTMMVQDHTDFVNSLQQFHSKHANTQVRPMAGFDVLAIKQELSRQCQSSTRKELGSIEGRQFDSCFMGMQLAGHMHMLDTLKVFERHASPELAELIRGGIDTTEDHLMHAKKWLKETDHAAAETARRSSNERKE